MDSKSLNTTPLNATVDGLHYADQPVDGSFMPGPNHVGSAGEFANKILRGEISAVEAYEKVIQKFLDDNEAPISTLREICADHEASCHQMEQIVQEEKGNVSHDSGVWGGFVKTYVTAASLFGENGALSALKRGEEHGLKQYEEALKIELNTWEKNMIENVLIPKQREHIARIESVMRH